MFCSPYGNAQPIEVDVAKSFFLASTGGGLFVVLVNDEDQIEVLEKLAFEVRLKAQAHPAGNRDAGKRGKLRGELRFCKPVVRVLKEHLSVGASPRFCALLAGEKTSCACDELSVSR